MTLQTINNYHTLLFNYQYKHLNLFSFIRKFINFIKIVIILHLKLLYCEIN